MSGVLMVAALLLDRLLGEPRRFHPLVGLGWCASKIEAALNCGGCRKLKGALAWCLMGLPALLLWALPLPWWIELCLLYLVIGQRSLAEHARAVAAPLLAGDLCGARVKLSYMVSRDTAGMDEKQICGSVVESVLENGNDAIYGALFWFALGGAPLAVLYRIVNTLDAMWGYRTERFNDFGFMAAKMDDLANYLPARIAGLLFLLNRRWRAGIHCWRTQAPLCASPNGGVVMATGAAILAIRIGGPVSYFGKMKQKPELGCGRWAEPDDIERAVALIRRTSLLFCALFLLISGGIGYWL